MTDDEIKKYLRPRPSILAVGSFLVPLLVAAAALGRWAFTAPTQEDYRGLETRTKTVELDHAVLKANVDGMRGDLTDVKTLTKDINAQLTQLRIDRRR